LELARHDISRGWISACDDSEKNKKEEEEERKNSRSRSGGRTAPLEGIGRKKRKERKTIGRNRGGAYGGDERFLAEDGNFFNLRALV